MWMWIKIFRVTMLSRGQRVALERITPVLPSKRTSLHNLKVKYWHVPWCAKHGVVLKAWTARWVAGIGIGSITHILNLDVGTGQTLGLAGELSFGRTIALIKRLIMKFSQNDLQL